MPLFKPRLTTGFLMAEKIFTITNAVGENLHERLNELGAHLPKPCGSSRCGNCKAKLISGKIAVDNESVPLGEVFKPCKAKILSQNIEVEILPKQKVSRIETMFKAPATPLDTGKTGFAIAMDIGTTTVALILIDTQSGKILEQDSFTNPQIKFGDDIITRIAYCHSKENLLKIQKCLLDEIEKSLEKFSAQAKKISKMFVAANTVMLHIFFGIDPSGMGKSPWTPSFLDSRKISGSGFFANLEIEEIVSLPSISAFVGADLSAAIALTNLEDDPSNILLVDIGTNAEMVLKIDGKLYCTSAAAGPALEGWGLTSAMRANSGAISLVKISGDKIFYETIDDLPPKGICATGYIDLICALKKLNIIGENGRFENEPEFVTLSNSKKIYSVTDTILIDEADIASILKAKAAVRAGLETLFKKFSITPKDIDKIYIAGGLGKNLNLQNAIDISFLPAFDIQKVDCIGNAALGGAYLACMSESSFKKLENISSRFTNISLNLEKDFEDDFIDAMFLP